MSVKKSISRIAPIARRRFNRPNFWLVNNEVEAHTHEEKECSCHKNGERKWMKWVVIGLATLDLISLLGGKILK